MEFSLTWFRSNKQKELEALQVEGQKLQNQLLKEELNAKIKENEPELVQVDRGKPYKKIKLVGDVLTIILHDGNILTKPKATEADFQKVRAAWNENDLFTVAASSEKIQEQREQLKQVENIQKTITFVDQLKHLKDFEVKDGAVYLKTNDGVTIERSLPALMIEKFAELYSPTLQCVEGEENEIYEERDALKKFWLKCCLNPNAQSAEDLYVFLSHHQMRIDRHGNFYAYRNVVSTEAPNKELVEFIGNTYNKVKAVWKKKPRDYFVWLEGDGFYTFSKDDGKIGSDSGRFIQGNLEELYLNLPDMQQGNYTDAHTRKFDYKIGEAHKMPRNEGDDNNSVSCSKGFHAASKAYDYSGFGDTSILVIINPMDVLAVPLGEVGKLRTARWFFATVLSDEEKHILDNDDFAVLDLGDIFEEKCQTNMQEYVQNSFAEEVKRHTFQLPQINAREVTNIIHSLEEMKNTLSKRVSEI